MYWQAMLPSVLAVRMIWPAALHTLLDSEDVQPATPLPNTTAPPPQVPHGRWDDSEWQTTSDEKGTWTDCKRKRERGEQAKREDSKKEREKEEKREERKWDSEKVRKRERGKEKEGRGKRP
jgi:hypothetical protein